MNSKVIFLASALALPLSACAGTASAPQGAAAAPLAAVPAAEPTARLADLVAAVDVPYDSFTLPNGLTTIVHTDRKAPIVGVSVWYGVGSKHEPKGKTGFAHLFEHLMFGGSENVPNFDIPLEGAGSTPTNGSTWLDRTNYVETVPKGAVDLALFMESDRMGHLLGAVTQEKLDQQRGVVQNEKRQGDNNPYGIAEYEFSDALYPVGHPYRHSTIGSMGDLNAASLADVKQWFRDNYGPNNAILVLAGDIDVAAAKEKVTRWFGDIPRGRDVPAVDAPVPTLPARVDKTIRDQVAATRLYRAWAVPGLNDPDMVPLSVGMHILGGLASSRLDTALVRKEQLAVGVTAYLLPFTHGSLVQSYIDVKPGVDRAAAEARYEALLADYIANGPTADELARAATSLVSSQIGALEEVGGFGGKGGVLAEGLLYSGNPEKYKADLAAIAALTPADVRAAMQRWLTRPVFALTVEPGERSEGGENRGGWERQGARDTGGAPRIGYYHAADAAGDAPPVAAAPAAKPAPAAAAAPPARSFPPVEPVGTFDFPAIERARLSNGIPVYYAQSAAIPKTRVTVSFDAGFSADAKGEAGTQSFMVAMLEEGTRTRDATAIAEEQERLGASIGTGATLDTTIVSLDALSGNLGPSLDLLADIVRNPAFAAAEVARVRDQQVAGIAQELTNPSALAARALPPLLYGADHAYGIPFTGTGDPAVVAKLTAADLTAAHAASMRPENAAIFVVGDVPLATVQAALEKRLGGWRGSGAAPAPKRLGAAIPAPRPRIILIDRPGAPQSVILGGQVLPLTGRNSAEVLQSANEILGNGFLSRLNMNLREAKGWSYGVRSSISPAQGPLLHMVHAPVQSDRTGDSLAEIIREMAAFPAKQGANAEEVARVTEGNIRSLPSRFETRDAVAGAIATIVQYGRPDDYYETLAQRYRAMDAAALNAAAARYLQPGAMTFVVVGDAASVRPQLEKLGLPIESMAAPTLPE